jgi:preprotein translocase subunit SecE
MANAIRTNREEQGNRVDGFSLMEPVGKLGGYQKRLSHFLHEVRVEMDKVSWPSWNDVRSTTVVVIITVALFGLFFLGTDSIASKFIGWLIDFFGKSH